MIKGGEFYAIYNENTGFWLTKKMPCAKLIDAQVRIFAEENRAGWLSAQSNDDKQWDEFLKYTKKLDDNYKPLDSKIIFKNQVVKREDYASKTVPYELKEGECSAWEELIGTLYLPEERAKLEWAIGAVLTGDSKKIQKFIVMYGKHGTGKSTILNIISMLTEGYNTSFDSEALGDQRNTFSLEAFADDPLVGIEHDGDLSKITTNTRLNMIVSHEKMRINEKFKRTYPSKIHTFLFMGTNSPVKITDSKSGLIRRLIDVYPSGNIIKPKRYKELMKQVEFELGAIAHHCIEVYKSMGIDYYYDYKPSKMLKFTNNVYDFLTDRYDIIKSEIESNGGFVILEFLWIKFKEWAEDNNVYIQNYTKSKFRLDVSGYFDSFEPRYKGVYYSALIGLKTGMFKELEEVNEDVVEDVEGTELQEDIPEWLNLTKQKSQFDIFERDSIAQYANDDESRPVVKWDNCKTRLSDIDTSRLHFIIPTDEHHIFVDFDKKDKDGKKSLSENIKAVLEIGLPPTYAETSKSGGGLHLHYIYDGNVKDLSSVYDDNIEIKVFPSDKKSSMRRKLTLCNNLPIAHISSGLPLREECKRDLINKDIEVTEKDVRIKVKRCLNKEYDKMPKTIMNVMFIKKLLDDLYSSGKSYDVSDLFRPVHSFASSSTNSATKCLELVAQMKWMSKDFEAKEMGGQMPVELAKDVVEDDRPLTFYDVEVFSNLFVICWKHRGMKECVRMINPNPNEVKELFNFKLVGFNNRDYDNHILYAAANGYSNLALYKVSQGIISGNKNDKFGNAYNLSYTDIYDFSNTKQSLKKWEIELGIHHLELGIPWDKPVPEELWDKVAEYCCNDVDATEALFNHLEDSDWTTRIVLSELSGLSRNETTNNHTCQIIFGNDKNPQREFVYTDLSKEFPGYKYNPYEADPQKKSTYRGYYTKEGGYADGIEGMWENVALIDIASMHPHTAKALNIFGDRYTARYYSLVETRMHIKHGEIDEARAMFDGKIGRIIDKYKLSLKKLDKALKVPINAVYGLTSAKFNNRCRDPRNVDNIVAKRGALFMITLRDEIRKRGFEVVHVKTDSMKIPNATTEIIEFAMDFAKKYGYTFEHEATYEKLCLVNHAVYIAKYASCEWCEKQYGYIPKDNKEADEEGHTWTATGTQFQIPYVFKTLFSHEEITFKDMCETKEVKSPAAIYLRQTKEDGTNDDQFIGRIGLFCPVDDIGGDLLRVDSNAGKEGAVTGTKGYKWLESEYVKVNGLEDHINKDYYRVLCDKAVETINQYCDFNEFVA